MTTNPKPLSKNKILSDAREEYLSEKLMAEAAYSNVMELAKNKAYAAYDRINIPALEKYLKTCRRYRNDN